MAPLNCDNMDEKFTTTTIDGVLFYRIGKKKAGRRLDGVTHNEYPEK